MTAAYPCDGIFNEGRFHASYEAERVILLSQAQGWMAGAGTVTAAVIAGLFGWMNRPKPKSMEAKSVDTISTAWNAVGGMLAAIEKDRDGLAAKVADLDARLGCVDKKLASTIASAQTESERCDRNMHRLQLHIERLCEMMRAAGLDPPPDPVLEK